MPLRTCVGCRRTAEKKTLVRVVMTEDGAWVDKNGRLPGRAVYLCADKECLAAALKKNAIARGLKVKKVNDVRGFAEGLEI